MWSASVSDCDLKLISFHRKWREQKCFKQKGDIIRRHIQNIQKTYSKII